MSLINANLYSYFLRIEKTKNYMYIIKIKLNSPNKTIFKEHKIKCIINFYHTSKFE